MNYLIAHKVRGQPAFDIAEQMPCPICEPIRQGLDDGSAPFGCDECDGEGFWWILSTCGYRARPYWSTELSWAVGGTNTMEFLSQCPQGWPDLFPLNKSPETKTSSLDLLSSLGLGKKSPPIKRRI